MRMSIYKDRQRAGHTLDIPSTAHAIGSTQDQEANITPWDPEPAQGRRLET